ncbi:MAG: ABC transporter ATP-binding protein [Clostridia bacterium]|nr:ABC transporter ATP-binding protein [Clostridia bacterium]
MKKTKNNPLPEERVDDGYVMRIENVNMVFHKPGSLLADRDIHVLKDVNLNIKKGEIIALIGESGCGKTTLGKIITGLYRPTSGDVYFGGVRVSGAFSKNISAYNKVQFIQQDSYAALNPVRTIYQSLYAPIKAKNKKWKKVQIDEKIEELMGLIGLLPSAQYLSKYPHQLSGGQRQRILMARAISLEPELIVADEPVSMIDVSLRLSVLNLMKELNEKLNMSFVYISHDLSTTRYIARNGRVCVMYLGEIVETGKIGDVISNPRHPYTRALIQAVPVPDPDFRGNDDLPLKSMQLGALENRGEGCAFYDRCLYATDECRQKITYEKTDTAEVLCRNLARVPSGSVYKNQTEENHD